MVDKVRLQGGGSEGRRAPRRGEGEARARPPGGRRSAGSKAGCAPSSARRSGSRRSAACRAAGSAAPTRTSTGAAARGTPRQSRATRPARAPRRRRCGSRQTGCGRRARNPPPAPWAGWAASRLPPPLSLFLSFFLPLSLCRLSLSLSLPPLSLPLSAASLASLLPGGRAGGRGPRAKLAARQPPAASMAEARHTPAVPVKLTKPRGGSGRLLRRLSLSLSPRRGRERRTARRQWPSATPFEQPTAGERAAWGGGAASRDGRRFPGGARGGRPARGTARA